MSKEEQIEEMANDLRALDCFQHNPNYSVEYQRAIGLYSLGYRKASDTAREIFEEIESCKWSETQYGDQMLCFEINSEKYDTLKKKYVEEEK